MSSLEIETFQLPSHWACYFINADPSSLDDADIAAADGWWDETFCGQSVSCAGPPKSVSMACWRGLTALALVGGNGSPPCPKSLTQQLISLIPAI